MTYILGVDGGASKTLAVLADETGTVLGVGRAGCANHQSRGLGPAIAEIRLAVERAFRRASNSWHIDPADLALAYYALAGADLPEDFELLDAPLDEIGVPFVLNNDTVAALRSGTNNPNAVVVLLGSGTNAAGRNVAGQEIRLPGLGWISGDWGGGGELAEEAIRLIVRAHDGRGRPTRLRDMVLQNLGVPDVDALVSHLYLGRIERTNLLQLPPLVFEAAEAGDAVARDLVIRSADEVVTTTTAILRRLDLLTCPADVVLGGSVFRARGKLLLDTIRTRLRGVAPTARVVVPDIEPVLGALFCAMDALKVPVDERVRCRAAQTYQDAALHASVTSMPN